MYLPKRHTFLICLFVVFVYLFIPRRHVGAVPNDGTNYLQSQTTLGGGNASAPINDTDTNSLCQAGGAGQCKVVRGSIGEVVGGRLKDSDTNALCESGGNGACIIQPGWLYTRTKYAASGNFTSTNLLTGSGGNSIDSFIYNLYLLPTGTGATVQFSQDKTNWVSSAGTANGTNSLVFGINTISLSGLAWNTPNFYYKIAYTGPDTKSPSLESSVVGYGATSAKLRPTFIMSATDGQNDYLRYKIDLCTDAAMTLNCQTFDQTSSQTGWSEKDTQNSTAYKSGTQAYYTQQTDLTENTTYYWRSYAKDPAGSNTWSAASTINSFTTGLIGAPTNCSLDSTIGTNQVKLTWTDNATLEDNFLLERSVDAGAYSQIASIARNTTTYTDTLSSAGTYNYRVRVIAGSNYSNYCTTGISIVYPFSGLQFEGVQIENIPIK